MTNSDGSAVERGGEPALTGAIALPDGTMVRGRGRKEPVPPGPSPDYGLYLGGPPGSMTGRFLTRREPDWLPDWPADWIAWPDFGVPRDSEEAAALICSVYRRARSGQRVEVACVGGTGRTGTVIACLAILAGQPVTDAVAWTRTNYRPRAVETTRQRRWIAWFTWHQSGQSIQSI